MSVVPSPAITSDDLESSPGEVWRTLTEPEPFERWMGPGSTIEPVPGGSVVVSDPESGDPKVGQITEVRPREYISWIWRPIGGEPDQTTSVKIKLVPIPDGTRVTVIETQTAEPLPLAPTMGRTTNAVGRHPGHGWSHRASHNVEAGIGHRQPVLSGLGG